MIFERDYNTTLPNDSDIEEHETWVLVNRLGELMPGVPGRIISCFNASANLCMSVIELVTFLVYAQHFVTQRIS
jgi:hypothetical protein